MELDKQTIKKIIGLISFAILLSWGLKNTEFIKRLIALALGLLQPFLIGGVIAFVVNVPMRALENTCFHQTLPEAPCRTGCCQTGWQREYCSCQTAYLVPC